MSGGKEMIIISQNKKEIINFDNIININIADCGEDGYLISAGFIVGRDDNYKDLGYYKTKERANEVLQKIIRQKSIFEYFKNAPRDIQNSIADDFIKQNIIFDTYEMPKK